MANHNKSSKDIQYSIWDTRTDKNHSYSVKKRKEAIDLPGRKDDK